ncbi:hypothetical protein ACUX4Y_24580, partial [Salmonella enterica]|uniref:hypothetical protein n=1 Tax=unclassified Salmonella TaxID=2614656 RepID=UPI00390CD92E
VPAYGPQNDVTLKMPAFEWVHVQLHQQKGMISLSPPTICNSAVGNMMPKSLLCITRGIGFDRVGLIIIIKHNAPGNEIKSAQIWRRCARASFVQIHFFSVCCS